MLARFRKAKADELAGVPVKYVASISLTVISASSLHIIRFVTLRTFV
jgi:hypothetical protein